MKLWNTNICLSSPTAVMVIVILLFSTLVLASVWPKEVEETIEENIEEEEIWIPTAEDIAYQDSMYTIIQNTQSDVDTIKVQVQMIIERLDHPDDTYDSIKYVKGGKIDNRRN